MCRSVPSIDSPKSKRSILGVESSPEKCECRSPAYETVGQGDRRQTSRYLVTSGASLKLGCSPTVLKGRRKWRRSRASESAEKQVSRETRLFGEKFFRRRQIYYAETGNGTQTEMYIEL